MRYFARHSICKYYFFPLLYNYLNPLNNALITYLNQPTVVPATEPQGNTDYFINSKPITLTDTEKYYLQNDRECTRYPKECLKTALKVLRLDSNNEYGKGTVKKFYDGLSLLWHADKCTYDKEICKEQNIFIGNAWDAYNRLYK